MEMEQLLSMGFPSELAAQALAATGGKSTVKATEWLLTPKPSSAYPNPNPNPSSTQPKLDHFFHSQSRPSKSPPSPPSATLPAHQIQLEEHKAEGSAPNPSSKRPKLLPQPTSPFFINRFHPKDTDKDKRKKQSHQPLYERMRPQTIDDVVGQDQLLSANSLLRSAIEQNRLPSIIFWGPPGTGKTSLSKAIVNSYALKNQEKQHRGFSYRFVSLSAVTSGVKDVRDVVEEARKLKFKSNQRTVLFMDEVHRFNKPQQDSFLPVIEDGSIVFIGATTENPSFHLITPLLSRCRVLTLNSLKPQHVALLLKRAVDDSEKGLVQSTGFPVNVDEEVIQLISENCDGDARVALNALEISAITATARVPDAKHGEKLDQADPDESNSANDSDEIGSYATIVTIDDAKEALQCKHLAYDKAGEEHYNLISALHKSMRGSDADAAIYWLARMLEGGEQPLYIARRLIRFACEDVGLADPTALNQAVSCYQACHFLGMPECNVILAQCAVYLALAPKSVSVYRAIEAAQKVVRDSVGQNEGVPLHLRNASTKLMKDLGYGKGYLYPPDNPNSVQSYLPPSVQGYKFLHWPGRDISDGEK